MLYTFVRKFKAKSMYMRTKKSQFFDENFINSQIVCYHPDKESRIDIERFQKILHRSSIV